MRRVFKRRKLDSALRCSQILSNLAWAGMAVPVVLVMLKSDEQLEAWAKKVKSRMHAVLGIRENRLEKKET